MSAPIFPGGTAVTDLAVYDDEAADGCRGGTPHLHTVSTEGYVVIGGSGRVQTVSADGFAEHALAAGDVVWFSPGTVHRLVNDGELRLLVVMSNAGLPEAGDAVMTFPAEVLDDPEAYAAASALPEGDARTDAVRARRDLALEGFAQLRAGGAEAWAALHERAVRLVQPRVAGWRELWEATVAADAERTFAQLTALAAGHTGALGDAQVVRGEPAAGASGWDSRAYGMCGRLATWRWPSE